MFSPDFPHGSDAVIYHLPLAVRWLQDGSLAIPASRAWRYSMPGNAEIGMMILLSSGKQSLVVMANWISALMITAATYLLAMWISKGNRVASITACLIVFSIPMIEFQVFSAFADLLGTAGVLSAFVLILSANGENPRRKLGVPGPALALVSGLACGISLGTKPIYYLHAAVFSVFMACVFWTNRDRGQERAACNQRCWWSWGCCCHRCFGLLARGRKLETRSIPCRSRLHSGSYSRDIRPPNLEISMSSTLSGKGANGRLIRGRNGNETRAISKCRMAKERGSVRFSQHSFHSEFCFSRSELCAETRTRRDWLLLFLFAALVLSWWIWMERVPRYGQPVWSFACVLSVPLIVVLQSRRRGLATLVTSSIIATSVVCASVPLHSMAGRLRRHHWSRPQIYNYPQAIDALPVGSVVLNASGIKEKDFALAGRQLTNRVIPDFEAPSELTAQSLCAIGADYVVEVVPGGRYPELSLVNSGATVVDDELVATGEDQVRWRIWRFGEEK